MSEAQEVRVNGRGLRCGHCGGRAFHQKSATIDRLALGGLVHLEGVWGHQATLYVCGDCGFAHWFLAVPDARHEHGAVAPGEPVPDEPPAAPSPLPPWAGPREPPPPLATPDNACLACGTLVPEATDRCPACGWSWADREERPV